MKVIAPDWKKWIAVLALACAACASQREAKPSSAPPSTEAAPSLNDLGGRSWIGKSDKGPARLHLGTGTVLLVVAYGDDQVKCELEGHTQLPAASPCEGRLIESLGFTEKGDRVDVALGLSESGDRLGLPVHAALERARPIELALGLPPPEVGNQSAETQHLEWAAKAVQRAERSFGAPDPQMVNEAFRHWGTDPATAPWKVATAVAKEVTRLHRDAGFYRLKTGKTLDLGADVRNIVRNELLAANLLPPPRDLSAPPGDADQSARGIHSKALRPGTGSAHPDSNDRLFGQWVAWTLEGSLAGYGYISPQFTPWLGDEAEVMRAGELRRFWVPGQRVGRSEELLMYDVELASFEVVANVPPRPDDFAGPGPDAQVTSSGLASKVLHAGDGKFRPAWGDNVWFQQTCWSMDSGDLLESTVTYQEPPSTGLAFTLTGIEEAYTLMVAGERRRVWLPPNSLTLRGSPREGPAVVCDLELVRTDADVSPLPAKDLAAAFDGAKRTSDGLAYVVVQAGTGKRHPRPGDTVLVSYEGWTPQGRVFTKRSRHEEPVDSLPAWRRIPGWSLAVQKMVEGETTRFLIPPKLSVNERFGTLKTPTVVQITLERIRQPGERSN